MGQLKTLPTGGKSPAYSIRRSIAMVTHSSKICCICVSVAERTERADEPCGTARDGAARPPTYRATLYFTLSTRRGRLALPVRVAASFLIVAIVLHLLFVPGSSSPASAGSY